METPTKANLHAAKTLSPLRKTTSATTPEELAAEQLAHFHIDKESNLGKPLYRIARNLYDSEMDMQELWDQSLRTLQNLDRSDRIAFFNAQKFLCFQLAKVLDSLQNPFRKTYQSQDLGTDTQLAKGPYPIFDNVTAIFSSSPVITRTATYIFACAEWIDDAFKGREFLHEVYSRLLNPTSIALANHIVDIEAGPLANEYFAWNFNSGMAAIDGAMSHLIGYQDVILSSRNIYGGTYQLLHDWFAKPSNLDVAVEFFDGYHAQDFEKRLKEVQEKYADRLAKGRNIYIYLESPCNPHGYVLDVPAICKAAHRHNLRVVIDGTVASPFLSRPLQRKDPEERPDFLIHSYTKDISGTGTTTAGVVIGRNHDMFIPKGDEGWENSMFWNVFYVKGAFLDADKSFEVLNGMKTLEMRMLKKCITTICFARWLSAHPSLNVNCNALPHNPNHELMSQQNYLTLPAPLFTVDMEGTSVSRETFKRFYDVLPPMFGHMVSLGMSNTLCLCPALTTHSEMSDEALKDAGIHLTTMRMSIGDENTRDIISGFLTSAKIALDPDIPGFTDQFPSGEELDQLIEETYVDVHRRYIQSQRSFEDCLK